MPRLRRFAPVDTGELRDSIDTAYVGVVGTKVKESVIADAPHVGFVEFGKGLCGEGA